MYICAEWNDWAGRKRDGKLQNQTAASAIIDITTVLGATIWRKSLGRNSDGVVHRSKSLIEILWVCIYLHMKVCCTERAAARRVEPQSSRDVETAIFTHIVFLTAIIVTCIQLQRYNNHDTVAGIRHHTTTLTYLWYTISSSAAFSQCRGIDTRSRRRYVWYRTV